MPFGEGKMAIVPTTTLPRKEPPMVTYLLEGKESIPLTREDVQALLDDGCLQASDRLRRDAGRAFLRIAEFPEFAVTSEAIPEQPPRAAGPDTAPAYPGTVKEPPPSMPIHANGPSLQSLVDFVDQTQGMAGICAMLRERPAEYVRALCERFPLDHLRLNEAADIRHCNRLEFLLWLGQILVKYDLIRRDTPEARLPANLPAKELEEVLLGRLIPYIRGLQGRGRGLAVVVRQSLHEFGLVLIRRRDRDALDVLLAARPGFSEDHEFWICACLHNIARASKDPTEIAAAIRAAEDIVKGVTKVPPEYVEGAKDIIERLRNLART